MGFQSRYRPYDQNITLKNHTRLTEFVVFIAQDGSKYPSPLHYCTCYVCTLRPITTAFFSTYSMCQQENCEDCKTSCNKLSTTEFTTEQNMSMCKQARCCVWGDGECHPIVECCPSQ